MEYQGKFFEVPLIPNVEIRLSSLGPFSSKQNIPAELRTSNTGMFLLVRLHSLTQIVGSPQICMTVLTD